MHNADELQLALKRGDATAAVHMAHLLWRRGALYPSASARAALRYTACGSAGQFPFPHARSRLLMASLAAFTLNGGESVREKVPLSLCLCFAVVVSDTHYKHPPLHFIEFAQKNVSLCLFHHAFFSYHVLVFL